MIHGVDDIPAAASPPEAQQHTVAKPEKAGQGEAEKEEEEGGRAAGPTIVSKGDGNIVLQPSSEARSEARSKDRLRSGGKDAASGRRRRRRGGRSMTAS